MLSRDIIADIFFNEIINEAKNSEVSIIETDNLEHIYNTGFNACIEGKLNSGNVNDSKPILMINNKEQLINKLEEYVKEIDKVDNYFSKLEYRQKLKAYMTFVWNNAIYEDFASPCLYLKKQIDFLRTPMFDFNTYNYAHNVDFTPVVNQKNKNAVNVLNGSDIYVTVKQQGIKMETPFIFETKIVTPTNEEYLLPSISYGISCNECYIYAIQDRNSSKDTKTSKNINRVFYTLNSGVSNDETEEFKMMQGLDKTDNYYLNQDKEIFYGDYPENISNVSPTAVISLIIFLDMLLKQGIDKAKVVSCLPVRYYGKELFYLKKHAYNVKKCDLSKEESEKLLLEYKKEHLRIQKNLSEKIIRNFRRLEYHFDNCYVASYPLELDEYLHFRFREFNNSNNILINCILDSRTEEKHK